MYINVYINAYIKVCTNIFFYVDKGLCNTKYLTGYSTLQDRVLYPTKRDIGSKVYELKSY